MNITEQLNIPKILPFRLVDMFTIFNTSGTLANIYHQPNRLHDSEANPLSTMSAVFQDFSSEACETNTKLRIYGHVRISTRNLEV